MAKPKVFTISQAAKELGISANAVRKAIKQKRLPATVGQYTVERTMRRTGHLITQRDLNAYRVSERHLYAGKKTD